MVLLSMYKMSKTNQPIIQKAIKPLVRWTIGPVSPDGFKCLCESIDSMMSLYDIDPVICFNCNRQMIDENLATVSARFPLRLIDQQQYADNSRIKPKGVAWKLYPSRLDLSRHEIVIDNDLIIKNRITQIDEFLESSSTLILEETSRTYGRFEKHVNPNLCINSGLYGMPPEFDLQKYVDFYVGEGWQKNATGEHDKSETFDEQGLVALALSSHKSYIKIPYSVITNCERNYEEGHGMHFIGLNRRAFHEPFRLYQSTKQKLYL